MPLEVLYDMVMKCLYAYKKDQKGYYHLALLDQFDVAKKTK